MQFSNILLATLAAFVVSAQTTSDEKTAGIVATMTDAAVMAEATGDNVNAAANSTMKSSSKAGATAKTTAKSSSAASAKASATTTKGTGNTTSTNTSTAAPLKVTGNAAPPQLLSQAGGLVTVAGLGAMFAVFM